MGVRLRDGGKLFCGGTIVSPKLVVSAAHCFEQVREKLIFVSAGHVIKVTFHLKKNPHMNFDKKMFFCYFSFFNFFEASLKCSNTIDARR